MSAPIADPGLMDRFRAAGTKIAWRPVAVVGSLSPGAAAPPSARIAHLHDEEARIETTEVPGSTTFVVDSGPVGALVLVLELDRRGPATRLVARLAGDLAPFPQGAIEAQWAPERASEAGGLPVRDLVALARYALA